MLIVRWYRFKMRDNQYYNGFRVGGDQSHRFGTGRDVGRRLFLRNLLRQVLILTRQRRLLPV